MFAFLSKTRTFLSDPKLLNCTVHACISVCTVYACVHAFALSVCASKQACVSQSNASVFITYNITVLFLQLASTRPYGGGGEGVPFQR